jgi:hypothetical protein
MYYVIALLFVCARGFIFSNSSNKTTFEEVIFQELPQLSQIDGRSACSMGIYNDTIFVLGGMLENAKIDGTIWAYDMKNNSWGIVCSLFSLATDF